MKFNQVLNCLDLFGTFPLDMMMTLKHIYCIFRKKIPHFQNLNKGHKSILYPLPPECEQRHLPSWSPLFEHNMLSWFSFRSKHEDI